MKGFQRIVREERAREIAATVLDQHRTFPNAIVLGTDSGALDEVGKELDIPNEARFLVIDGQHRLWAQNYSDFEAQYCCVVHMGLEEQDMARLFLEINNNQKRVPASLRWDLVRLIEPEEQLDELRAAELTFELATRDVSPLFQRIDLTGEQPEISLKQGSVAPEIKDLVAKRKSPLKDLDFERQFDSLVRYFAAIKSRDPDRWKTADSPLYGARVVRALIRLLPQIIERTGKKPEEISVQTYRGYLERINLDALAPEKIRAVQGSAGVAAIHEVLRGQVLTR